MAASDRLLNAVASSCHCVVNRVIVAADKPAQVVRLQSLETSSLELADAFASDSVEFAHFVQRERTTAIKVKSQSNDGGIAGWDRVEATVDVVVPKSQFNGVQGLWTICVFDQVSQVGTVVLADRGIEGDGLVLVFSSLRTLSGLTLDASASSTSVGARPSSLVRSRRTRWSLSIFSILWTGMRMRRPESAMPGRMDWQIHQVA